MKLVAFSISLAMLAGCSDEKKTPDAKLQDSTAIDAPVDANTVDAPPDAQAFVLAVTCPANPAATITSTDGLFVYTPASATVAQNAIVRFVMSATHDVRPSLSLSTDPGVRVLFGETKCLQFTITGTFNFFCGPHGFTGAITVN